MIKVVVFDVGQVLIRFSGPQFRLYRLAKRLQRAGIQTAILSNVVMPIGVLFTKLHIYRGFEPVILSYEERITKPNPKIYELAIKKLGVKPNEIVFIDNLAGNLRPAQALGIHTICARRTSQVIKDLEALLKQENNLII